MKMVISFFAGIAVSGLLLFGAKTIMPTQAETDGSSENVTSGLADLLPDIEGIYRQSLVMPFKKAESKIYDEDIAEFYRELLESTGLVGTEVGTD